MIKYNLQPIMVIFCAIILFSACQPATRQMKEGRWRGEFVLPENRIPFIFEVSGTKPDSTVVYLVNGAERVQLKNISYRNDSVFIPIDLFELII